MAAVKKLATAKEIHETIHRAVHSTHTATPITLRELGVSVRTALGFAMPDKWIQESVYEMHMRGDVWIDPRGWVCVWQDKPVPVPMGHKAWTDYERGIVVYPQQPAWKDRELEDS